VLTFYFFSYFATKIKYLKSKINIPKAFFSFLIASFFIWLLINLSKEYTTTVWYEVSYKNLPQNKVFQQEPLQKIPLTIKATGFKLLSTNFKYKGIAFDLKKIQSEINGKNYILTNKQKQIVQDQLYNGLRLQQIEQDTIHLFLGSLSSKKIPVKANINVTFKYGCDLATPLQLIPDSVLVSGPKQKLDSLTYIDTKEIILNSISENTTQDVFLQKPSLSKKIKIAEEKVQIVLEVDKFTEGSFMVPFEIENLPKNTTVNTYPKNIKIVFKVGLSNFNKITANSFKVVCDYKESKENNLPYLIPKLVIKPVLVSSVRIKPTKIEFLIQQ